jgi:hypothetical protein
MPAPLGQAIVPASGATATRAKYGGSPSGSNTPLSVGGLAEHIARFSRDQQRSGGIRHALLPR